MPDEVTDRMVEARLDQPDAAGGFLLDGYPRNLHQVASLDAMLARRGTALDVVLEITADAWSGSAKKKIEAAGGSLTAR